MQELNSYQRKYLKGLAHGMKPLVFIGQKGLSSALKKAVDEALKIHELIKVKFMDYKEKEIKKEMAELIEKETSSQLIGIIGHMAIFYRRQDDPEKRKIDIPQ
jgi:RNA-binding protein